MDPATIEALLSLTKSLEDVGKELGTLISHATETPDVANRVVRYLEVVQTAVYALGRRPCQSRFGGPVSRLQQRALPTTQECAGRPLTRGVAYLRSRSRDAHRRAEIGVRYARA